MDKSDKNPVPFRLNELKKPLQEEAMRIDRSLHWLVINILKNYVQSLKK